MNKSIFSILAERVVLLDGAMGTMLQPYGFPAKCPDELTLTHPEIIGTIHHKYIDSGADIITTNSLNSNILSLQSFGMPANAYELAKASAEIACEACRTSGQKRRLFVAGCVGPAIVGKQPDGASYSELRDAYISQIEGLIAGGCDIILIETIVSMKGARAAVDACGDVFARVGLRLPVMLSATLTLDGRLPYSLSNEKKLDTLSALCALVENENVMSIGLNCSYGAEHLSHYIKQLSTMTDLPVSFHPNAGMPDVKGNYPESSKKFADEIRTLIEGRYINIVGGCCGTTPTYINEISKIIGELKPRRFHIRKL